MQWNVHGLVIGRCYVCKAKVYSVSQRREARTNQYNKTAGKPHQTHTAASEIHTNYSTADMINTIHIAWRFEIVENYGQNSWE